MGTKIVQVTAPSGLHMCDNATVACQVQPVNSVIWWTFNGDNITEDEQRYSPLSVFNSSA